MLKVKEKANSDVHEVNERICRLSIDGTHFFAILQICSFIAYKIIFAPARYVLGQERYIYRAKNIETENVKLSALSLTPRTLSLAVGNETKLKLLPSPLMADLSRLNWTSSDPTAASVNENGLVHSNAPGEAVFTAAYDSFEATCRISVEAREKDEYRIESIIVSDGNGKEHKQMPSEKCLVTVNLRKLRADVDSITVMLAFYDSNGQWGRTVLFQYLWRGRGTDTAIYHSSG